MNSKKYSFRCNLQTVFNSSVIDPPNNKWNKRKKETQNKWEQSEA